MSSLSINNVKTRFAPSPTGFLHLGNIRTAFFAWIFSKKYNGSFILRIDDTDRTRYSDKYVNNIFDILSWLNISYDNVFFQSERYSIYKTYLDYLLKIGKAYKCYCCKDRLVELKNIQIKNKVKIQYDGFCKKTFNKVNSGNFVIRFNSDRDGYTTFNDLVKGSIKILNFELDDFIIAKGYLPTYNFASAVDDVNLGITHIIRGEDHIVNTQKQIMIIKALNERVPYFAHLPMLLDDYKRKISKRNNFLYLNYYKTCGFLPKALLNYIVRLGWSKGNQEIFDLDDIIKSFNFKTVSKSSSCTNFNKLLWLNKYYLQRSSFSELFLITSFIFKKFNIRYIFEPKLKLLLKFNIAKFNTVLEFLEQNLYFYYYKINFVETCITSYFSLNILLLFEFFYFDLKCSKFLWNISNLQVFFSFYIKERCINFSNFALPLRILITGNVSSSSLYEIIFLCGKILLLKKIKNIINKKGL